MVSVQEVCFIIQFIKPFIFAVDILLCVWPVLFFKKLFIDWLIFLYSLNKATPNILFVVIWKKINLTWNSPFPDLLLTLDE